MRGLLFLGVLLALLWVGWNKVQEVQGISKATPGEGLDLGLPTESPFASNFEEQYLCLDSAEDRWKMYRGTQDPFASDCAGPFIDTRNLCLSMARMGVESVELLEGRTVRCD